VTFWELLGIALGSTGLFASVLGAFLTYAARKNGEATRGLIESMEDRIAQQFDRMDKRANETTRHFTELLERMDKRADERHREVIGLISGMKTT